MQYVRILRKGWALIVVSVLLAVAASAIYCLTTRPVYSASAQAFVSVPAGANVQDLSQGGSFAQQIAKSYAAVAATPYVLDRVVAQLKLKESSTELITQVSATAGLDTQTLTVTAENTNAALAAKIADAVTMQLTPAAQRLNGTNTSTSTTVTVTLLQSASLNIVQTKPRWISTVVLWAFLGAAIGFILAFARSALDTKVRTSQELEAASGLPLLGTIPSDAAITRDPLATAHGTSAPIVEAFRTLRLNLAFTQVGAPQYAIAVTSAIPNEGKTTTVANLALAAARAGMRILVVDADLRKPRIADVFGLDASLGLTDVLINQIKVEEAIVPWGDGTLDILPAGSTPPNPGELIQSIGMGHLVDSVRHAYDLVIFDTPPMLAVSDSAALGKHLDGILIVAGVGDVRRPQLLTVLKELRTNGLTLLGVVATKVPRGQFSRYATYAGSAESAATAKDL